MTIKVEAKRTKTGQSLTDYETAALNAVAQLKSIKTQVVALKQAVSSDTDFTTADEADVQATIDTLLAAIAGI